MGFPFWVRALLRLALLAFLAALVGFWLNHLAARLEARAQAAGFGRGMLQGALMPMALPNLLVGRDVQIYTAHNTGVSYKLGYTVGVNVCGAIFFGFLFWRLRRLRTSRRQRREGSATSNHDFRRSPERNQTAG